MKWWRFADRLQATSRRPLNMSTSGINYTTCAGTVKLTLSILGFGPAFSFSPTASPPFPVSWRAGRHSQLVQDMYSVYLYALQQMPCSWRNTACPSIWGKQQADMGWESVWSGDAWPSITLWGHPCLWTSEKQTFSLIFASRCYIERGYATVCRLSVCLSLRPSACLWRSGTVIT